MLQAPTLWAEVQVPVKLLLALHETGSSVVCSKLFCVVICLHEALMGTVIIGSVAFPKSASSVRKHMQIVSYSSRRSTGSSGVAT